jgi:hypothetical protein
MTYVSLLVSLCGLAVSAPPAAVEPARPLPQAHAHNDYEHRRPLLDALSHGFTGVEADIYLVDGKLLVAHNRGDVLFGPRHSAAESIPAVQH